MAKIQAMKDKGKWIKLFATTETQVDLISEDQLQPTIPRFFNFSVSMLTGSFFSPLLKFVMHCKFSDKAHLHVYPKIITTCSSQKGFYKEAWVVMSLFFKMKKCYDAKIIISYCV